jgi:hypothetical protein
MLSQAPVFPSDLANKQSRRPQIHLPRHHHVMSTATFLVGLLPTFSTHAIPHIGAIAGIGWTAPWQTATGRTPCGTTVSSPAEVEVWAVSDRDRLDQRLDADDVQDALPQPGSVEPATGTSLPDRARRSARAGPCRSTWR